MTNPTAVPPFRVSRSLGQPLSAREWEVLAGIAEGKTNAEIAGELFISVDTVKSHVLHILRKIGARNRTHAVALVLSAGPAVP